MTDKPVYAVRTEGEEPDPECPVCGHDVQQTSGTSNSGMEYSAWTCNNCAWVGDPE